jgi:hypothetical protein
MRALCPRRFRRIPVGTWQAIDNFKDEIKHRKEQLGKTMIDLKEVSGYVEQINDWRNQKSELKKNTVIIETDQVGCLTRRLGGDSVRGKSCAGGDWTLHRPPSIRSIIHTSTRPSFPPCLLACFHPIHPSNPSIHPVHGRKT